MLSGSGGPGEEETSCLPLPGGESRCGQDTDLGPQCVYKVYYTEVMTL